MIVGALIEGLSEGLYMLVIGRFISGIASGCGSAITNIYISELSPANKRGTLGALFQVAMDTGFVFVATLFFFFDDKSKWRYLVSFPMLLGVIQIVLLSLFGIESPLWLTTKYKTKKASEELKKIYKNGDTSKQLIELECLTREVEGQTKKSLTDIFSNPYKRPVLTAAGLLISQQLCGINGVMFYSSVVFNGVMNTKVATLLCTSTSLFATILSSLFGDHFGRRLLLFYGAICMFIASLVMTFALHYGYSILSIMATIVYILGFGFTLGPIPWLMLGELVPAEIRSYGGGFCALISWIFSLLVGVCFPYIHDALDEYSFLPFSACLVCIIIFIHFKVPETSGKTFSEIQEAFKNY